MHLRSLFALGFAFVLTSGAGSALAQARHSAGVRIVDSYARPTVMNQPTAAAYLTIENSGKASDKLLAISSPVAKSVQIHTMSMDGNVMKMREVQDIELKPAEKVVMQPGNGYHLMLFGLRQPLKAGDKIPLTLTFEKAGKARVLVLVENRKAAGGAPRAD